MALRARAIVGVSQPQDALMLDVAIRASGGERLLGMMDRAIVTSQAGVIVGVPLKASLR
jgi:hypothetical protein